MLMSLLRTSSSLSSPSWPLSYQRLVSHQSLLHSLSSRSRSCLPALLSRSSAHLPRASQPLPAPGSASIFTLPLRLNLVTYRPFSQTCIVRSNTTEMEKVDTTARLKELREQMKSNSIDVYVVPSEDAHQSEYVAPCDSRRAYISGFSGSAGVAVITLEKAALATDGRYFNQAGAQLDGNWELLKQGLEDVPTWQEWTATNSEGGKVVGIDSTVLTADGATSLKKKIVKKGGKDLVGLAENLVDKVWKERPARPSNPVKVHDVKYAGKSFQDKIEDLRKALNKKNASGMVVSMLDDIAWLFNLRGDDIAYNPVFFSYAIVTASDVTLYVDESKLDASVKSHLGDHVKVQPYDSFLGDVATLGKELTAQAAGGAPQKKILLTSKSSWAISQRVGENNFDEARSPITEAKAIKNDVEKEGMRQCHIRDGAALSEYFAWLEEQLVTKGVKLDEVQGADQLEAFRKKRDLFVGLSFDTISSTGPNAAVIHYKPEPGLCSTIDPAQIYLCDSGAQYVDGTTDTTRTMHFGEPTPMEIKAYTLVLKGMIAIDRAVFPRGTNGMSLDVLARQHLWAEGLDYRHGTGHGVGSFLNVHEGPIGIGTRLAFAEVALSPGNVISDEPGYYEDGKFGIRIENIVMAREVETTHHFNEKPSLGFEHVTQVPLCHKLIDVKLLTAVEKDWVNTYHKEVWDKTSGFFKDDARTTKWLERECAAL